VKIVFDAEALLETREVAAFYEDAQPGMGRVFLDTMEQSVAAITRHPKMWRRIQGRFRRYLTPRFPYGLIYAIEGEVIYIAAVMHLKRKPGYWFERTKRRHR